MEFVSDVFTEQKPKCHPNLVPIVSLGTDKNFIRINGTDFEVNENQAMIFLQALDHNRFTSWTYSDNHEQAESGTSFSANWTLLLSFIGAVLTFYTFGRKQKEEAYNTVSVCLLNVFRLSLGQPLRKDPQRWSMRFVLLSWVLFQMHASIIYQGVLMSYHKSYGSHIVEILVIPNSCLKQIQRLFETGLIVKMSPKRGVTSTLKASSQTQLLLQVLLIGWVASAVTLVVEIWTHRHKEKSQQLRQGLEKCLLVQKSFVRSHSKNIPPLKRKHMFYVEEEQESDSDEGLMRYRP